MSDTTLIDDAIRVVVAPSQASYFAGEPFSVTITFTNTRTQELPPARSASHSVSSRHKRTAHSISSVPLARPPTSPGNPRTAVPTLLARTAGVSDISTRKGLIGQKQLPAGTDESLDSMDPMRKRVLTKSLSISVLSSELEEQSQDDLKSKASINSLRVTESAYASPTSPRTSSPLARSASLPIAPSHPHARKQSILDGQLQPQELRPPVLQSPFTTSPSTSSSSFSLSLDPIAESSSSPVPPMTPFAPSPVPDSTLPTIRTQLSSTSTETTAATNGSAKYVVRPSRGPPRRPPQLGHGPPPVALNNQPSRTTFSSSFVPPNSELILYSYAQLVGTLAISPVPGSTTTAQQAQTLSYLRSNLLKRKGVGGGSMDITSSMSYHAYSASSSMGTRGSHGRSSSLSAGLLSLLSPTSLMPSSPAPQPWMPSQRPQTASVFSLFSNGDNGGPIGLGLGVAEEETDPELPLPTFEVQPSLLAVDLSLAPGESRTYTYTIVLPAELPPTHKGRVLRFSYQFILGICRSPSSLPSGGLGPTGANSSSRVMKVPIRVYNNVVVGRAPMPYDLLWPCKARGSQFSAKVIEESRIAAKKSDLAPLQGVPASRSGTFEDLQVYARGLLAVFHHPSTGGVRLDLPVDLERDREREEAGGLTGCRQAVEILTRNPKKASYDVNKDGVKVAVLTFTKSAYRLGETVLGVVELNERSSRARVLKLSAMLEAHESLPSAISSPASSRQTRRVHAEHHSSFVVSTLRTTFSLDIPPDASPAFQVTIGGEPGDSARQIGAQPGGLEWKVRLCLLVAVASPTSRQSADGLRLKHLVKDGPRGEWGTSWKAAASIAPLERPDLRVHANPFGASEQAATTPSTARSWMSYLASSLLGPANEGYHDGDELADSDDDDNEEGSEDEWRSVRTEMVECEVPIRVWPGNTAFKATEVVFDV
ncbi:hypothetical protein SCP_0114320 [Sparassis crispa]|uniref:Rgp1-domain-containing protein n=1 Tax=Sparassis crispa TaxID=139825 RepID=A0A401G8S8_9APHY|nr:hypothetical protein SCP_0114320 [Sparassis crispa]GBE78543.1 hypothetical protein SCP_0114320 [Sparassis crispa]